MISPIYPSLFGFNHFGKAPFFKKKANFFFFLIFKKFIYFLYFFAYIGS